MSPLERLLEQIRSNLDNLDGQNLANLARAFDRNVYKAVAGDIDALEKLMKMETLGVSVRNTTEYKRLLSNIETALTKWAGYMEVNVPTVAGQGITYGIDAADALMKAQITGTFRKMNPEAVEKLLGYLQEGSPLYKRIGFMSTHYPGLIADAIVNGVTAGKNPRYIADLITKHLGMALTNSLRTTRTVQIWSYREANRASYVANSDVVEKWIWYATLDSECCMSCIALSIRSWNRLENQNTN